MTGLLSSLTQIALLRKDPGSLPSSAASVAFFILLFAAADLVIASTGNTTCQQILAAGRPWLAIPEWRYFDEQHRKAQALAAAGVATTRPHLPSSAEAWQRALAETLAGHDAAAQCALTEDRPATKAADWLESLADHLWRVADPVPVRA